MSDWRDINKDAWTFTRKVIVGSGGGFGEYKTAYAVNRANGILLNGRIAADLRISKKHVAGGGLICRGDEYWTFLAFYTSPAIAEKDSDIARIGLFKEGLFTQVATSNEPVHLTDDFNHFELEFFSGRLRGEIRTAEKAYELSAVCPHIPFPGYVGLVKFYGADILVKNVLIEKTDMPFATAVSNISRQFEYDVFLCHSSADKPIVEQIARNLRNAGITYWLDGEQIKFGDQITAKIEEGLQKSRYIVPCVSANVSVSGWARAEYGAVLNAELSGVSERVVIPLRLDDCNERDLPLLLRDKKRVTYSNKIEMAEFVQFLRRR